MVTQVKSLGMKQTQNFLSVSKFLSFRIGQLKNIIWLVAGKQLFLGGVVELVRDADMRKGILKKQGCRWNAQIREQMSGPDLHTFTLKSLALKKLFFTFSGSKHFFEFFLTALCKQKVLFF